MPFTASKQKFFSDRVERGFFSRAFGSKRHRQNLVNPRKISTLKIYNGTDFTRATSRRDFVKQAVATSCSPKTIDIHIKNF